MADRDGLLANAVIKVIGVGGAGGNAINTMIRAGITGVEFIAANTDIQSLKNNLAPIKIQLGRELTKGLGAGANPDVGRDAALEDKAIIQEVVSGADMVFITGGLGGGTGTGAAPIIAQVAREMGALTVGVVTKPFTFEGKKRRNHADGGMQNLRNAVDTLITIPNQRLLSIAPANMPLLDAFKLADEVLLNAVKGINDIINVPGLVNADFADVRTTMSEMGMALMGTGIASGANRAQEAARLAINSPLLEDVDIEGATGLLINITGPASMTMQEYAEAATLIQEAAHEDANVIVGCVIDDTLQDSIRVTVIATGFDRAAVSHPEPRPFMHTPQQYQQQSHAYSTPAHTSHMPRMDIPAHHAAPPRPTQPYTTPVNTVQQNDYQRNLNNAAINHQRPTQYNNPVPQAPARPTYQEQMPQQIPTQDSYGEQGRELARRAQITTAATPQPRPITMDSRLGGEFEDLAKWTLDLARTQSLPEPTPPASTFFTERPGASVFQDNIFHATESETESAMNIARELAGVALDDDYETPSFLRRREDTRNP
jgi:cell division protein FtsZ